ncbi:MAG: hypothetical protein ABR517_08420 [Thermoanaerobaculia bacterium]
MQDERTTSDAPGTGSRAASSKMGKAKEMIGDRYSKASDQAKKTYGSVREKVSEVDVDGVMEQVRAYVRENPGKALLFSVGAGFLLGLLLRSDDDEG